MSDLLATLRGLGVVLAVEGGRLRLDAPRGVLTAELRAAISAGRGDLLRALAPSIEDWVSPDYPRTPCPECGASSWAWSARRGAYICLGCECGQG